MQLTLKRIDYDNYINSIHWYRRLQIGCYEHSVELFLQAVLGDIPFGIHSIIDTKTTITIHVMAKKKKNKIITTFDHHQPQILPLDECVITGTDFKPAFKLVGTLDDGSQYDGSKANVTSFIPPGNNRAEYKGAGVSDIILRMDRVLLEPDPADVISRGGIYIPEELKPKSVRGKVISIGPGLINGEEMETQPGDIVIYPRYMGTEINIDNKEYLIIPESDISAVEEYYVDKIS